MAFDIYLCFTRICIFLRGNLSMNLNVSIIIINWNGWQDTIECLESIYQNDYPNYDVIVVDNDSNDESSK